MTTIKVQRGNINELKSFMTTRKQNDVSIDYMPECDCVMGVNVGRKYVEPGGFISKDEHDNLHAGLINF